MFAFLDDSFGLDFASDIVWGVISENIIARIRIIETLFLIIFPIENPPVSSAADIKYLDHLRRMFSPSCKAPERVEKEFGFAARTSLCELNMLAEPPTDIVSAVASASEGNEAGGKTDK